MILSEMVWENKETFGCEYFKLIEKEKAMFGESTVIYVGENSPIQIDYQIELDLSWKTKSVIIKTNRGKNLHITSSGKGEWFDQHGMRIEELTGAIDVDISATPFSNSLPINRFEWKTHQKREFEMVYVSVPSLEVRKVKQTYTYMEGNGKTRVFHYECQDFESLISVDEKGFVIDYPQLFSRRY